MARCSVSAEEDFILNVAAEDAGFGGVSAAEDAENVCVSGAEGLRRASAGGED